MKGLDYPQAWAFVKTTKPEDHHERCSWRTENGALLCDCDVIWDEHVRRGGSDPRGENRMDERADPRVENSNQVSEGDLTEVRPSDSRAESQAGLNGPSGSPTSPSERAPTRDANSQSSAE